MVEVTELVSQMHETLSDIRSTISSITSLQHESLLDNVEKHRDTTVASLELEFTVETTDLAQRRAAEISAIEEQRRREDEEREARRRQEDAALKAKAKAEDDARQLALATKTLELEEQTEAEMARIEAEADRMLDEGQARLVTLEQRRKDLNRQIDEQMSLPLPIVPLRRKSREQALKTAPVAISTKEELGETQVGEDHAVLSASTTETTAPANDPTPTESSPQTPRVVVIDRELPDQKLTPLAEAIIITPSDNATFKETTLSHDHETFLGEESTQIAPSDLPTPALQLSNSDSMIPALVEKDIAEPVDKDSTSIINELDRCDDETAAAETVPEEKPAQEASTAPVVSVETVEHATVDISPSPIEETQALSTDDLPENDEKPTEELETPETEAEVHEEEHEAVTYSVPSVVVADEEVAHEHPEETSIPEIQIEASEITLGNIPSIEFIPPTPAPEKTTHELPEVKQTEEKTVETNDAAEPEESAPIVHDLSHQPDDEAAREIQVSEVTPVVAPLPVVEAVAEPLIEETSASEAPAASSETLPTQIETLPTQIETLPTQIETPIEILTIPALPSFEPKVVADLKNTIATKEDEEPVLMYLPSTCYSPEPPVFVFPSPPPASVPNEQSDVTSEHGVEVQDETRHEEEAHILSQEADVQDISSLIEAQHHDPEEATYTTEAVKVDTEPIVSALDVEQLDRAQEPTHSGEHVAPAPEEFHEPLPKLTTELANATPVHQFFEQQTIQDPSSAWHYQAPYVAPDVYAYAAPQFVDESSYFASPQSLEPSPFLYEAPKEKEPAENAVTVHGQDDLFDVNNESDGSISSEFVDSPREDQFEYDNISIDASGNVIVQHRSPVLAEAEVPETPTTIVGDAQSHDADAEDQAIDVARPVTPESTHFRGLASSRHAPADDLPAPVTPPQLYDGDDDDPSMDDEFMPRDVTHISWGEHNIYTTPGSVRSEATVSEASLSATPYNSGHDLHDNEPFIRNSWVDTPPDSVLNSRNKALRQLDYALSLDTTTPTNTPPTTAMLQQQQQPKSRPSSIAAVSPSILFQRMRSIFEPANGASAAGDGNTWTTTTPTETPPQNRHYNAVVPFVVSPGLSSRDSYPAAGSTGNRLVDNGFIKVIANASATVDDPERRHDDYHHHHQDEDGDDSFGEQTSLLQEAAPVSASY
ncbi:hypothetical protein F503_06062 [Ophiostoma piceae UAMH 11346]|uniref:Uncharacterized protein n=1 Tax=Ophiostoma piceae (strain UAMH 11346) TaxID=1262450 RepID=S3CDF6_OPHP1|nr:hypothetical protein F503_06062 [Ophiostoma piceae UAMH 11346]